MKTRPDPLSSERGFSYVDLLLVLALAAILMSIAVPSVQDSLRSYRLSSAAERLAGTLNRARVLAVSQGAVYQVQFNVSARTFSVVNQSDSQFTTPIVERLPQDISFRLVPRNPVTFSSRGVAHGGVIVLASSSRNQVAVIVGGSGKTQITPLKKVASETAGY